MSNLIEKLGGYNAAKSFVHADSYSVEELQMMQDYKFNWTDVKRQLLEHRRQNNIFEEGDWIYTNDPASEKTVYQIIMKHGDHYKIQSRDGYRYCREWRIGGHCTDKEIAQGFRDE